MDATIVSSSEIGIISPNKTCSLCSLSFAPLLAKLEQEVIEVMVANPADMPNIVIAFPAILFRSSCCSK